MPIIDLSTCDGCGLCVQVCPQHALTVMDAKARVSNPQACEYSGHCELICPVQAIVRPFQIIFPQTGAPT
ncbi:MAG: 4Fe-4S binding protein [Anaerolineae bacterium]|nr:4Fe-4S binding protein [Anaerolineae bacterium]